RSIVAPTFRTVTRASTAAPVQSLRRLIPALFVVSLSIAAPTRRAVNRPETTSQRQGKPTNCILGRILEIGADSTVLINVVATARTANVRTCGTLSKGVPCAWFGEG